MRSDHFFCFSIYYDGEHDRQRVHLRKCYRVFPLHVSQYEVSAMPKSLKFVLLRALCCTYCWLKDTGIDENISSSRYCALTSIHFIILGWYNNSWDPGKVQKQLVSLSETIMEKQEFLPDVVTPRALRLHFHKQSCRDMRKTACRIWISQFFPPSTIQVQKCTDRFTHYAQFHLWLSTAHPSTIALLLLW